jgi:hypothetical protein
VEILTGWPQQSSKAHVEVCADDRLGVQLGMITLVPSSTHNGEALGRGAREFAKQNTTAFRRVSEAGIEARRGTVPSSARGYVSSLPQDTGRFDPERDHGRQRDAEREGPAA